MYSQSAVVTTVPEEPTEHHPVHKTYINVPLGGENGEVGNGNLRSRPPIAKAILADSYEFRCCYTPPFRNPYISPKFMLSLLPQLLLVNVVISYAGGTLHQWIRWSKQSLTATPSGWGVIPLMKFH